MGKGLRVGRGMAVEVDFCWGVGARAAVGPIGAGVGLTGWGVIVESIAWLQAVSKRDKARTVTTPTSARRVSRPFSSDSRMLLIGMPFLLSPAALLNQLTNIPTKG